MIARLRGGSDDQPKNKKQKVSNGKEEVQAEPKVDKPKVAGTLLGFVTTKSGKEPVSSEIPKGILDHLKDEGWKKALAGEFSKPYFAKILSFLEAEKKAGKEIFPPENQIFDALNLTPFDQVKVVILGQDPYHDNGQAHGLCFSVQKGIKPPPSLKNIYKELATDIPGFVEPSHGNLEKWAREGVLLLNATLTVQAHTANSHASCGWLQFTDAIIKLINDKKKGVVFILWGGFAQKKGKVIDSKKHHVILAAHPSPLSVTKFWGCKFFQKPINSWRKMGFNQLTGHCQKTSRAPTP